MESTEKMSRKVIGNYGAEETNRRVYSRKRKWSVVINDGTKSRKKKCRIK